MTEFAAPDFVNKNDVETLWEKMKEELPSDIATTPGSMAYNFLHPVAVEKAEMIEFQLVQTLMLMFPEWSWDEWLDLHAKRAGCSRKEAVYATGGVTVTGPAGTELPIGTIFSTAGTSDIPAKEYISLEYITIPEGGSIDIQVQAAEAGAGYDALPGTVCLLGKPIDGVSVCNKENITGGIDREDDESLRKRIDEKNQNFDKSYVGSIADYKRWAKEVSGVNECIVQDVWNGPGTIRLIITGLEGQPVPQTVLDAVYEHIMRPEEPEERLAPAGGIQLTISTSIPKEVSYQVFVLLEEGVDLTSVTTLFREKLDNYYLTAKNEGILRYSRVYAILSSLSGVDDCKDLLINGACDNILLPEDEYPVTVDTILTEWEESQ